MSTKSDFFRQDRFMLIGDSTHKRFPKFTQKYLTERGKTVYAVDLGGGPEGSYASIEDAPDDAEAAIIEVDKERTADVVDKVLDRGITRVWIHQLTETPEATELAVSRGATVETGGCAVMYLAPTASPHALHRGIWKLIKRY